jgi:hypothetical protein
MQVRSGIMPATLFLCFCLGGLPVGLRGQSKPQRRANVPLSRVDLFGGFAYFHPYAGEIGGYAYQPVNAGAVTNLSAYFNRYFGLQAEGGFHPDGPNDCVYSGQGGPIFRLPRGRWIPFVHVLGGGAKIGGPAFQPCSWGWGVTSGLGMDYVLPQFHNRLALHLIQADWQYSHVSFGPLDAAEVAGGAVDLEDYRLASGIVLRLGSIKPALPPLGAFCSLQPQRVFVGDPVTVSLQTDNLDPRKKVTYSWTSTAGTVRGSGESVTIDTKGLAAGSYSVNASVVQGHKPSERARCSASFALRTYDPPTVTCVANPDRVKPGNTSEISARGVSPQDRPLTYTFSADAGQISNSGGNTTTLSTIGAPVGSVTVTCTATDDLGKSAHNTTTVTIIPQPFSPPPQARPLCSQSFARDRRRPLRVDNEAKACLDEIALALRLEPDAKLELVGHADSADKTDAAAQRAVNAKQYLIGEKEIDGSRIELRTSTARERTVDAILVPAGASFSDDGATLVDEKSIEPQVPAQGKTPRR